MHGVPGPQHHQQVTREGREDVLDERRPEEQERGPGGSPRRRGGARWSVPGTMAPGHATPALGGARPVAPRDSAASPSPPWAWSGSRWGGQRGPRPRRGGAGRTPALAFAHHSATPTCSPSTRRATRAVPTPSPTSRIGSSTRRSSASCLAPELPAGGASGVPAVSAFSWRLPRAGALGPGPPAGAPWWLAATPALGYLRLPQLGPPPHRAHRCSLLALTRGHAAGSGALAALGTATKLFPAALVPAAFGALAAAGRRPLARWATAAAGCCSRSTCPWPSSPSTAGAGSSASTPPAAPRTRCGTPWAARRDAGSILASLGPVALAGGAAGRVALRAARRGRRARGPVARRRW